MKYKDGEPCEHPGCLNHVTQQCEGCGRVAGKYMRHIRKILPNDELLLDCNICGRVTVLYDEDDGWCHGCGNEIEQQNIDAWTEYAEIKGEEYFQQMRERRWQEYNEE